MSIQAMARSLGGAKKVAPLLALLAATLAAVAALGLAASAASAATFSNTDGPITINDGFNCGAIAATPYPSEILVSGLGNSVTDVNVTVSGLSHSFPDDVGLLLVSPEGQSVILMTDSGDGIPVFGINLTFDDAASGPLPDNPVDPLSSGTYKPSVGTAATFGCGAPASFPAPAPSAPYGSSLSVFNGSDPNGTWKLYVFDDGRLDVGSITGWSLEISTTTVPTTKAQCKKGGWRDFVGYPDQGTCITFVNENRP